MARIDSKYSRLLFDIMTSGYDTPPAVRQQVGARQLTSCQIRTDVEGEFPLLTTKEVFYRGVLEELFWFLSGETNIKRLVDKGVHIWNGDAYTYYCKFASANDREVNNILLPSDNNTFRMMTRQQMVDIIRATPKDELPRYKGYTLGDLGPVYGKQWVNWETAKGDHINQVQLLVDNIKKAVAADNNDRGLIVSAWNVGELREMALRPCHKDFQCVLEPIPDALRGRYGGKTHYLNLVWSQRSVDTVLGLPFNIASYAFLQHMLAQQTGTVARELVGNLTCVHIYDNHTAAVKEQIVRDEKPGCHLILREAKDIFSYKASDFAVLGYAPHPSIKAPLNN